MRGIVPFATLCAFIILSMYSVGWRFYSPDEEGQIECVQDINCLFRLADAEHPGKKRRKQ